MTELFAASMATTSMQAQIQNELFAMPQEIPLFDQIPVEDLILVKAEEWPNEGYVDINENDIPDGYSDLEYGVDYEFCDTNYSDRCYTCNILSDSDCEEREPCICTEDSDGDSPKWCERCPNPDLVNDTLPRWLRPVA